MKKLRFLVFTLLLTLLSGQLFSQKYVRPITLKEGVESQIITVDKYESGELWIREGKKFNNKKEVSPPSGKVVDSINYLLVNGAWMETVSDQDGSLISDKLTLPLDGVKIDDVQVSNLADQQTYSEHKRLENVSLICRHTLIKYRTDTLKLSEENKDVILDTITTFLLYVGSNENAIPFRVVANNKLVKDDLFISGDTIILDLKKKPELIEKLGLNAYVKDKSIINKTIDVNNIQIIPEGRVFSIINKMKIDVVEVRSEIPPVVKQGPGIWLWVIIAVCILLIALFAVLFQMKKKSAKKQQEEKNENVVIEPVSQSVDNEPKKVEALKTQQEEKTVIEAAPQESVEVESKKDVEGNLSVLKGEGNKDIVAKLTAEFEKKEKELIKKAEAAREDERKKAENEITRLKGEKQKLSEEFEKKEKELTKKAEAAREDERKKAENEITKLKGEKQRLSNDLEKEKKDAEERVERVRKEEKSNAERKISELTTAHKNEVSRLQDQQKVYTDQLTIVPYAKEYAKKISNLIDVVNSINIQAGELENAEVEDSYMIYRTISRFNRAISKIDYKKMLLDVSLAADNEMSFANSGITNLKTVSQDQMFTSLRGYFLSAYLEKYINAAMVYNESLAGMDRLVTGLTPKQTAPFSVYRDKLKECFKNLGISVVSVKLFDKLGDNVDLKVRREVDFGDENIPADTIIEIENCLVYPEGGRRPQDKIYVVVQK